MAELLTRSASLTGYADLARSLGLDPHRLAASQRLPARCLTDPDLSIPAVAVARLFERSAQLAGAMDFGLRLAETRKLSNLGAVAFVLQEQPTLRKALDALVSYTWAQNQALSLTFEIHGDIAVLREHLDGPRPNSARQSVELTLGVLVRTIRSLVGGAWRPLEVSLASAQPADVTTHRRVFGVTPLFDQEVDGIIIDAHDLDIRIANSDPVAAQRAQRYVEMEAGLRRHDTVAAVRQLVMALLPTGSCNIERVTAHMGVSRRTLHRQLTAGGSTFTVLVNETRADLAQRYIASRQYSLTQVAERLGYSSLSAFSRWRRRTLGVSASRRRRSPR